MRMHSPIIFPPAFAPPLPASLYLRIIFRLSQSLVYELSYRCVEPNSQTSLCEAIITVIVAPRNTQFFSLGRFHEASIQSEDEGDAGVREGMEKGRRKRFEGGKEEIDRRLQHAYVKRCPGARQHRSVGNWYGADAVSGGEAASQNRCDRPSWTLRRYRE